MAPTTKNRRAGDAAARERLADRLDGPNYKSERHALQPSPSAARVDELLVRLSDRLRLGRLDGWGLGFTRSIISQARRAGPRWRPSAKQLAAMEGILAESAEPDEGVESLLIEPEVPDGWIP